MFAKPLYAEAFVTASIAEPTNLIPYLASDSASAEISRLIFNGLVKYDKDLKLVGDLAESFEIQDGGLKIIFHLRKNVKWQDGEPFTAEDVKFTFDKIRDPQTPTPYAGNFEKVSAVNLPDAYTIEVLYKEAFAPGLESWGMGLVPRHMQDGKIIGTGPYKLKKWAHGEKIELEANPDYFDGAPKIQRYVYRIIPDQTTTYMELATENLDMVNLSPVQYLKQTGSPFFKERYQKYRISSFAYSYLAYNLTHPFFADKRVRHAIGLAIDKSKIIDVALLGFGKPATGPFLPDSWAYNPAVQAPPYDPEAARALLAEAGWKDADKDGFLDKDGLKFEFTVLTNQGNDQRRMACEIIQRNLKAVGIDMRIQIIEWGTLMKQFIMAKKFDAVLMAWHLSLDPDIYDIFYSQKTRPGEFNFIGYKNARVDELLIEGRREFDVQKRAGIYKELHALIAGDEPYTFLYVGEALPIVHKRFQGVETAPIGIGYNFKDWFVPEDKARYRLRMELAA